LEYNYLILVEIRGHKFIYLPEKNSDGRHLSDSYLDYLNENSMFKEVAPDMVIIEYTTIEEVKKYYEELTNGHNIDIGILKEDVTEEMARKVIDSIKMYCITEEESI